MKTSFFKRAIATVSVVPIALTQCLSVANAVDVNETAVADGNVVTLDTGSAESRLYIAPDEAGLEYVQDETAKTFTKLSNWGSEMQALIMSVANSNSKTGTLDASKLYEQAVAKSGQFAEVTQNLIDKISDVTYTVNEDGTIVIKASLADITPTYTEKAKNTVGGALKDLADQYGIPELENTDSIFDGVVIGGDLEVTIDGSQLSEYNVSGKIKFTDLATGKVYEGASVIDWALESFELLKTNAKEECDKYADIVDTSDAYKQVDDSMKFYVDKLELAKKYLNRALNANASRSCDDITPIITAISNRVKNATGKNIQSTTASELVATDIFADAYTAVLDQLNTLAGSYTFDIDAAEIGTLGDSFYDIEGATQNGVATFTAKFPDKEAAAAEAYLENTYDVDVTDVYKEVKIVVDFSAIEKSGATANVIVKRVATYEEITTTTTTTTTTSTTTSTSTSTTTTTDTDDSNSTTTTTTTDTDDSNSTTTTSTTDTDDSNSTTTTSTTDTDDSNSTTTTTTEGYNPWETTTTTTTENPDGPSETTTTTENPDGPTVTTTRTEMVYYVEYNTDTTVGFYLDVDPEFNMDQIKSVKYQVKADCVSYDENDVEIGREEAFVGTPVEIRDVVGFMDVPAEVLAENNKNNVNQFASQIAIYAKSDIIAEDGRIIAYAGDVLTNVDGSKVSVTAYIGVKGDADLDGKADSADSTAILVYYAKLQTGESASETQLSTNDILVEKDPMLDELAAFLADVDNENEADNFTALKPARTVGPDDASFILVYFAEVQTGKEAGRETWNEVLGDYAKN